MSSKTEIVESKQTIDIVIPTHPKDVETLVLCIKQAKKYVANVRRIIIISPTIIPAAMEISGVEYVPDSAFPFNIEEIAKIFADETINNRSAWYFQQLVKFYIFEIIPDLTDNVLILDSDVIFLRRHTFVTRDGTINLTISKRESHQPYYEHMAKLFPHIAKANASWSGVSHHSVFNRQIIQHIMKSALDYHTDLCSSENDTPAYNFWRIFLKLVNTSESSGASEYEIYFNYSLILFPEIIRAREIKWYNYGENENNYRDTVFVAVHNWKRAKNWMEIIEPFL
jgi:hypothetical protein